MRNKKEKKLEAFNNRGRGRTEMEEVKKISPDRKVMSLLDSSTSYKNHLKREFAFECASRLVEDCDIPEVKEYFTLLLFMYESGMLDTFDTLGYKHFKHIAVAKSIAKAKADNGAECYFLDQLAPVQAARLAAHPDVQMAAAFVSGIALKFFPSKKAFRLSGDFHYDKENKKILEEAIDIEVHTQLQLICHLSYEDSLRRKTQKFRVRGYDDNE